LPSFNFFSQFFRRDFAQIVIGLGFYLFQIFSYFLDAVVFIIVGTRIIGIALQYIIKINIHHKEDMQVDVSQGRETGTAILDKVPQKSLLKVSRYLRLKNWLYSSSLKVFIVSLPLKIVDVKLKLI